jgi:hypothetical protein
MILPPWTAVPLMAGPHRLRIHESSKPENVPRLRRSDSRFHGGGDARTSVCLTMTSSLQDKGAMAKISSE